MVRSSTALASTKSGLPLPFTQMKSSSARCGNSTVAPHEVVDLAPRPRRACGSAGPAPRPGQPEVAAVPVVARRRVAGRRPLPRPLVDLLAGARAGVERAAVPQRLDRRRRATSSCADWKYGPSSGAMPEPVERGDDPVGPLGPVARLVGVLDPQDERPPVLAHEEPVEQRRPRAADVEVPGRRRREARPGRGGRDRSCGGAGAPRAPAGCRGKRPRRQSSSMEMAPVGQPLTASRSRSRNSSGGCSLRT